MAVLLDGEHSTIQVVMCSWVRRDIKSPGLRQGFVLQSGHRQRPDGLARKYSTYLPGQLILHPFSILG